MRTHDKLTLTLLFALVACGTSTRELEDGGDGDVDVDADTDVDVDSDSDVDVDADTDVDVDADSDADSDIDADVDTDADETACTPGERWCEDAGLFECGADGDVVAFEPCELGCLDEPEPHCASWVPSNVEPGALVAGVGGIGPGAATWVDGVDYVMIDTGSGRIALGAGGRYWDLRAAGEGPDPASGIAFEVVPQPDGPPALGLFSVTTFELPPEARLWAIGPNALVLAASGPVTVAGTFNCKAYFDGYARTRFPGPGGFPAGSGPGAGGPGAGSGSTAADGGGGGAGHGGAGGASGPGGLGGTPGERYGTDELVPLLG